MLRSSPAGARSRAESSLCLGGSLAGAGALADPADDVFVPYAEEGIRVVTYGAGVEHGRDGARETQQTASVGWSPTARWFSSVYAGWVAADGGGFTFDEWSWLNHVQLTTPGAGPVDVGLLCELERPHDRDEGTGIVCGPTLQADTDRLQVNFNPLITKYVHAAEAVRRPRPPGLPVAAQGPAAPRPRTRRAGLRRRRPVEPLAAGIAAGTHARPGRLREVDDGRRPRAAARRGRAVRHRRRLAARRAAAARAARVLDRPPAGVEPSLASCRVRPGVARRGQARA